MAPFVLLRALFSQPPPPSDNWYQLSHQVKGLPADGEQMKQSIMEIYESPRLVAQSRSLN
jgi:hypothetical protein